MTDFFSRLFDPTGFPARWQCGSGWTDTPWLGWLHILSDLGIWSAYFAIPCILGFFVLRRRDVPFRSLFWLFGAFILACGTTHLIEAILFWHPLYRLAGVFKLLTAIVSWGTVVALVPIIPKALALRSPEAFEREIDERKRLEVELRRAQTELEERVRQRTAVLVQQEARLRLFIAHAPAPVAILDRNMKYLAYSRRWLTDYGLGDRDITGLSHSEIFPDLPERWKAVHRRCLAGTVEKSDDDTFLRPDGQTEFIRWEAHPWADEGGAIGGVIFFSEITTGQKKATEAIRRSEQQLRELADAMPQIVWAARPDGYLDYYNERWYEFTGFSRGEYGQASWEPNLHPEDLVRCRETYFRCVQEGQPYQIEYRLKDRRTGGYRWHLGRALPVRDEAGRIVRWYGTCTDIDDQKQAEGHLEQQVAERTAAVEERASALVMSEAALQRQTSILESVLDSLGEGVIVSDDTGRIVLQNRVAEQVHGTQPLGASTECWSTAFGLFLSDEKTPFPEQALPLARARSGGK